MNPFIYIFSILLLSFSNLYSQLEEKNMDKSIRPQDDLYNHVNGQWMKNTTIPDDKVRWGAYEEVREKSDETCLKLLKTLSNGSFLKGSEEQKVKDFYLSIMDTVRRNNEGLKPLREYFDLIDRVTSSIMLQQYLERVTAEGRNPFYNIYVSNHMKKSSQNALYLSSASLSLGRDYYQKNDQKSKDVLESFRAYVETLLSLIQPTLENRNEIAKAIVEFEKLLASNMLTVENLRNPDLRYNPVLVSELDNMVKSLNIQSNLKTNSIHTDTIIIPEVGYFQNLDRAIESKDYSILRYYLKFKVLDNSMSILSAHLDSIQFNFYGKTLSGQKIQRTLEKRALSVINGSYGEILGKLYIKKNFPPEAKKSAKELVAYLKLSFADHIKNLQWMSPETKTKALEKLSKITVKIGYPDKWKDYSTANVLPISEGGNYFLNHKAFQIWKFQDNLAKLQKPVDRTEWGMNPQTVNAYYSSLNNEIVFPAAILQPPFYNYKVPPSVNFGGIGGVIGHEITHGFDDGGSKFDGDGNLNNWWTKEDREKFEKAAQALVDQYNKYEPLPGVFLNGKFTLGENIADLGGMSVSFDAMTLFYKDKKLKLTQNEQQNFFKSWATIWRTKLREKEQINRIKTDPHSPGYFRSLGPTVNLNSFHQTYETKPGDKMYKEEKDRIIIW